MGQGVDEALHEHMAELLVAFAHMVGTEHHDRGGGVGDLAEVRCLIEGRALRAHGLLRRELHHGVGTLLDHLEVALLLLGEAGQVPLRDIVVDHDLEGLALCQLRQGLERQNDRLRAGKVAGIYTHGGSNHREWVDPLSIQNYKALR